MSSPFEVWEERAKLAKISRFVGQSLEVLEEGVCKITLPFRDDFEQTFGVVHGGIINLIADTAGYFAAATKVGDTPLATAEIKMNYIGPVFRKEIHAIGKVVKAGKQLIICELKVYTTDDDKLVALGTATYSKISAAKDKPAIVKQS
jgi:uncharacterized protein (TIGR00369 family)